MAANKAIEIIPVPFDLGAGRRGASCGPGALLQAGLEGRLRAIGCTSSLSEEVRLHGFRLDASPQDQIVPSSECQVRPKERPAMQYPGQVAALNGLLAARVSAAVAGGRWPLVLGGDHSIAIGTIAGLSDHYRRLGVLWMDAHSDLNTDLTTPSGHVHGMSLAASLGLGPTPFTMLGGRVPKINPEHVAIVGARSLDPEEKLFIRSLGLTCYTMHDIDKRGIGSVMEEAIQKVSTGTDGVHVSFDIDSLDPGEAPGTGTPVGGGLSKREAYLAMELLADSGVATSAEFVELNPMYDSNGRTAALTAGLIASLLGERIL